MTLETNNINESEALSSIDSFSDLLSNSAFLEKTNAILSGFQTAFECAATPDDKKYVLQDYVGFVKFLLDFYKGGIEKVEGGDYKVNKDWYHPANLEKTFGESPLLDKCCDDEDKAELSCEPILLFDDSENVKKIAECIAFSNEMLSSMDTQILSEAAQPYNMAPLFPKIKTVLDAAKSIGVNQLTQAVVNIRGKLIALNGKPISAKDRALGRSAPPEAYILIRLEERLANLKRQGTRLLQMVKAASAEDNEITPEEYESIKENFVRFLNQPIKNETSQSMGPLLSREVTKLEQSYGLTPQALADDFISAIEQKVEDPSLKDNPNKYFLALQDIFKLIPNQAPKVTDPALTTPPQSPTNTGGQPTLGTQGTQPANTGTQGTTAQATGAPVSYKDVSDTKVKSAAFSDLRALATMIGKQQSPDEIARAAQALAQKFSQ